MISNGIQSYRRTNVITSDPKRLVLMCYEGAIESLKSGKQKIIERDLEGKVKAISRVRDIISELQCSLDHEKGGAIARNLDALYNYMQRRILHGDLKNDIRAIEEVIGMLNELKSAWEGAFYKQERQIKPEEARFYEDRRQQASGYMRV